MNQNMANQYGMQYLEISAEISRLEKKKEELKKMLLQEGSFETDMYCFDVKDVDLFRVVDANTLLERLGMMTVEKNGLIRQSSYKKLTVKAK
jgi:hypothetical protein